MSLIVFAAGAAVLIYSAEKLITYLVGAARGLAISLFLLAILFTGIEFDDLAFGVVLNLEGLEDVALGVVFGTVISMSGLVLALAALIAPCKVEIPKDYIAIFAIAPLILVPVALLGELGVLSSIVLVLLFVAFVGYVAYRESRRPVPTFRNAEVLERMDEDEIATVTAGGGSGGTPPAAGGTGGDAGELYETGDLTLAKSNRRPGWQLLLLAVVALLGLVVGAYAMSEGTSGILENFEISGTVFGATIATIVLSLEDIFLTVEPARKGAPAIGVGNVIGSVVFSVTAKLGIIVLAGGAIVITSDVFTWHLPALVVINGFAAYALYTGYLKRWHGAALLVGYIAYWAISFSVFGLVPVDDAPGQDDDDAPTVSGPAVPGQQGDDDAPAAPGAPAPGAPDSDDGPAAQPVPAAPGGPAAPDNDGD
jgi:cation:H+ antiporter